MKQVNLRASTSDRFESGVSVETPDHVEFTFSLAGLGTRMMAYLIDLSIRIGLALVVGTVTMVSFELAVPGLGTGMFLVILFFLEWGYHTLFEWLWHGATPGKRALSIRVVRTDGVNLDFVRSAMRNLLRAADLFPFAYATGIAVMFFSGTERRLGDFAADTIVVRENSSRLKALPPLPEGLSDVRGVERLLDVISERDLALIDEFFRRRKLFSAERARELAALATDPMFHKLGVEHADPERLLASILLYSQERRSSWHGLFMPPGEKAS